MHQRPHKNFCNCITIVDQSSPNAEGMSRTMCRTHLSSRGIIAQSQKLKMADLGSQKLSPFCLLFYKAYQIWWECCKFDWIKAYVMSKKCTMTIIHDSCCHHFGFEKLLQCIYYATNTYQIWLKFCASNCEYTYCVDKCRVTKVEVSGFRHLRYL